MCMLKKLPSNDTKVLVLVDARKSYPYNAYIYSDNGSGDYGENSNETKSGTPTQDVLRLVGHIAKTNRNIKTDNLFSCLEVFQKLTEKGLTFVETIKGNKRAEFLPHRNKEPCISIYDL